MRTWLGRLARDNDRKIAGSAAIQAALTGPLGLIARLLRQRREDRGRDKLYSLHAPEVECIGKGKAQARYEFGVKVSIATTNAAVPGGKFVLGARALPGNPYDGHILAEQIAQAERVTGIESSAPMSTAATAATTPTRPACSSQARSAASRPPFAASGGAAAPSSPSSAT